MEVLLAVFLIIGNQTLITLSTIPETGAESDSGHPLKVEYGKLSDRFFSCSGENRAVKCDLFFLVHQNKCVSARSLF